MDVTFQVKEVSSTLLDKKQGEIFWRQFADNTSHARSVRLGEGSLEVVADALELDADGVALDLERYVQGRYRSRAKGPGGNRLGDFGECLTYLLYLGAGRQPVRVVSTPGRKKKGQKFPQPDFVLREGRTVMALEVKTTEALQRSRLLAARWKRLQPCCEVEKLRQEALPQLGFSQRGEPAGPFTHALKFADGSTSPFPVDGGEAVAVLAVDGRVATLQSEPRFKTPHHCLKQSRSCWRCLEADRVPVHAVVVKMHNEPGRLGVLGSGESGTDWLTAYSFWEQAVWSRELAAVRRATQVLSARTVTWLRSSRASRQRALEARVSSRKERRSQELEWDGLVEAWGQYLAEGLAEHGLDNAFEAIQELRIPDPRPDPLHRGRSEPLVAEQIDFVVSAELTQPYRFSSRSRRIPKATFSLYDDGRALDFRLCSSSWWDAHTESRSPRMTETADSVAAVEGVTALLESTGGTWAGVETPIGVPLEPARVAVDGEALDVGWRSKTIDHRGRWDPLGVNVPRWIKWLAYGDPRATLFVLPDGRVHIKSAR